MIEVGGWFDPPEHPGITAGRAHEEARGCPCWTAMQQDPECPLHGRPEFRDEKKR